MEISSCFYIYSWESSDRAGLKRIASSGIPIIIHAEDLQRCDQPDEILVLFPKEKLHIISYDVDDKLNHLEVAIRSALSQNFTHMLSLNQFSEPLVEEVLTWISADSNDPDSLVYFVNKPPKISRLQAIAERSLSLEGVDYRRCNVDIFLCPLKPIEEIQLVRGSKFNNLTILIYLLLNSDVEPELVQVETSLKQRRYNWRSKLSLVYYETWLLILSVLRQNYSPGYAALSLAMGVFCACTPFYGLQTLLIFSCAVIFRLSFPLAFLGSQVSLPPFYSLLVPLQIYVGLYLTGGDFDMNGDYLDVATQNFYPWLIGAMVVGGLLAFLLGGLWYVLQMFWWNKSKNESSPRVFRV